MIETTFLEVKPPWMEWVKAPLLLLAPDGVTVVALNAVARRLFGTPVVPLLPCPLDELIGTEAARAVRAPSLVPDVEPVSAVVAARVGGGSRTLSLDVSPVDDPAGYWLMTVQDHITEAEAASYVSTLYEDLEGILEWLPVGVEIFNSHGYCIFTNSHGARLFGYGADELNDLDDWWPVAYPDPAYRALAQQAWADAIEVSREQGSVVLLADWMVTCRDGTKKLTHFRFRCIGDNQVVVYWDVSEQRRLESELRRLAGTDELTGLRNRRSFFDAAMAAFDRAAVTGEPVSLLMVDLDHFKTVNDRHGHAAGDEILKSIADTFARALRENDLLARLGGEEFAVLLPATDARQARRIARRMCRLVSAAPVAAGGVRMGVTVSIGGTTAERMPCDLDRLLAEADVALYSAKHAGRDRVAFYDPAAMSPATP